ncbi:unnamed protein product, partial [Adineta ricciae]
TLFASDHGQPKQTSENQFELHLIDVNDCSPHFVNSSNFTFDLNENNQDNFLLQTIQVDDPDEHDQITLQLQFDPLHDYKHLFKLNERNQLIVLQNLDYEKQSVYQFAIQAEDKVGHQTSVPVIIHIHDVNDNPVKFPTNSTRFQIEENQASHTFIGQIQAEDEDKNDQIVYSIHPDDLPSIKHLIQLKTTGFLFTKRSFDRETLTQLHFRIVANDSIHTDVLAVRIDILDQNDNKPQLQTQSPYCYIYNLTNSNQTIEIQLEGYDSDEGRNGEIVFSLKNPSSSDIRILPNGLLILDGIFQEYRFDLDLTDQGQLKNFTTTYKDFLVFIVYEEAECRNYSLKSSVEIHPQTYIYLISIILISLASFLVIIFIICCCFYYRQRRERSKSLNNKPTTHLTPSFSSSLNDEAENDTLLLSSPSPQFTAMTTVSTSSTTTTTNDSTRLTTFTDRLSANKSASLSSSSSSTYVKMSRSFEDEIL